MSIIFIFTNLLTLCYFKFHADGQSPGYWFKVPIEYFLRYGQWRTIKVKKNLGIEFCITFSVWARKMGNFLLHIQIGKRDCLQLVEKIKRTPALDFVGDEFALNLALLPLYYTDLHNVQWWKCLYQVAIEFFYPKPQTSYEKFDFESRSPLKIETLVRG